MLKIWLKRDSTGLGFTRTRFLAAMCVCAPGSYTLGIIRLHRRQSALWGREGIKRLQRWGAGAGGSGNVRPRTAGSWTGAAKAVMVKTGEKKGRLPPQQSRNKNLGKQRAERITKERVRGSQWRWEVTKAKNKEVITELLEYSSKKKTHTQRTSQMVIFTTITTY